MKNIKELEGIELGEPCQLFNFNERNRTLCTKVDCFLFEHKLSWATAHFFRCNLNHSLMKNIEISKLHVTKKVKSN